MENLQQMHQQSYSDMPFEQFVQRVHRQFYADMPFDDFARRAGIRTESQPMQARVGDAFIGNEASVRGDPALASGIERRRLEAGPQLSPTRQIAVGHENSQIAGAQRVSPDTSRYGAPLSTDVFQLEDGQHYYHDRATGRMTRVGQDDALLLDQTGRPAVYARNPNIEEGRLGGFARVMAPGLVTAPANQQFGAVASQVARQASPVVEAAGRLGVDIPRAVASDRTVMQQAGNVVANVPGAGAPMVRAARQATDQIQEAAGNVAGGLGATNQAGAGATSGRAIRDWITTGSDDVADQAYRAVTRAMPQSAVGTLPATQARVAELAAQAQAANLKPNNYVVQAVREVMPAVQNARGLSYEGLRDLRSYIGRMSNDRLLPDAQRAPYGRLYEALTTDLGNLVQQAGSPRARELWERANRTYAAISERREALARIVGARGDVPAEQVFARLAAAASDGGRANIHLLNQARRTMNDAEWREVAGTIVQNLGQGRNAEFSLAAFGTNWRKMSAEGRNLLFGASTPHRRALDDIATLAERAVQFDKFGNPSGTGRTLSGGSILYGLMSEPVTTLTGIAGTRALAGWLAQPATAQHTARWMRAYDAVQRSQVPARVNAFREASQQLVNASGGQVSMQQFMQLLQTRRPAADERNEVQGPRAVNGR